MGRRIIICIACTVAVLGCKTDAQRFVESGGELLDVDEVRELYRGNVMAGVIPSVSTGFYIRFLRNGRMTGKTTSKTGEDTDKGTYKISDDGMVCYFWTKWKFGNRCVFVYHLGDLYKAFTQKNDKLLIVQKIYSGDRDSPVL
ncbi:MAG: hypothetical protein GY847_06375 [Proteobacteria bacterium]|nr:hypothetical protein [Pseudomonadota bacterium]